MLYVISLSMLFLVGNLAVLGSPRSPGCSSSSQSPVCSEEAGAPSPAGPSPRLQRDSSPAAHGSGSRAGSSTWPFPCGFSGVSLPCPTRSAGGHWPLPAVNQNKGDRTGEQGVTHLPCLHSHILLYVYCIPDSATAQSCHSMPESYGWSSSNLQVAPSKLTLEKNPDWN